MRARRIWMQHMELAIRLFIHILSFAPSLSPIPCGWLAIAIATHRQGTHTPPPTFTEKSCFKEALCAAIGDSFCCCLCGCCCCFHHVVIFYLIFFSLAIRALFNERHVESRRVDPRLGIGIGLDMKIWHSLLLTFYCTRKMLFFSCALLSIARKWKKKAGW